MTEYTLADVSAGDRVTLEHDDGSKLVRDVIGGAWPAIQVFPGFSPAIQHLTDDGWRITAVVKPAPALPTEPGWYTVADSLPDDYTVFVLNAGGIWLGDGEVWARSDLRPLLPFTRLAPVPETAKAVLDRLVELFDVIDPADSDLVTAWNNVAAEFGVDTAAHPQ